MTGPNLPQDLIDATPEERERFREVGMEALAEPGWPAARLASNGEQVAAEVAGDVIVSPPPPVDEERELLRVGLVAQRHRAVDGATFLREARAEVDAVWGSPGQVLWPKGEAIMVVGPEGVGKTTLVQQLLRARLGLQSSLLRWPVEPDPRRVLYIAADRPAQAQRSMRRMFTEHDYTAAADRLTVWKGPLPTDLAKSPALLSVLADHYGAGTVIVDSLKDVALDLTKDDVGARVNAAVQTALADNVEIALLHHQRKQVAGGTTPKNLEDVYGSRWLTAGCGSVFMIWGKAGDSIVELLHLKQPAEDVGPLKIIHDHTAGASRLVDHIDAYDLVNNATNGITAVEVAAKIHATPKPAANLIEKARRRLDALAHADPPKIHKKDGTKGGVGGGDPARYYPLATRLEGIA